MGTHLPPSATPQQTSCWDLLPGLCSATIRGGGRIQTEELIASLPQTSSSSCPVLNNKPIIFPLSSFSLVRNATSGFLAEWKYGFALLLYCTAARPRAQAVGVNQPAVHRRTMDRVLPRLREISGNNRAYHFGQTSNQQVSQPGWEIDDMPSWLLLFISSKK